MTNLLGEYLRGLRHAKAVTTRQLGGMAKCDCSGISRMEIGQRTPRLNLLWRIIEALDGDFGQALFLLCLDSGVPEEVARDATRRDCAENL